MQLKIKICFLRTVSFFLSLLLSFSFVFSFLWKLYKRTIISVWVLLIGSIFISLAVVIAINIYSRNQNKKTSKNKFDIWVHNNKSSLKLYLLFIGICSWATGRELSWTYEKAKDVLSMEWTILSIALALFVVWHTIIPQFLEDKKPNEDGIRFSFEKASIIEEKYEYSQMVTSSFGSLSLLSLNIFILIFATLYIYIVNDDITLAGQNITIVSFFLGTNSFLDMFLGILTPLTHVKEKLLRHTDVTQEDFRFVESVDQQLKETSAFFRTIDSLEGIDDDAKKKIKSEAAKKFLLTQGVEHDQL